MEADLPLRRRLLVRLLAGAVLIALVAIAATAWLASRTTTDAIRRAQDRSLAAETRIYDALVRFAATHRSWHGVAPTVTRLEAATGRHIVLTDRERGALAGTPPTNTRLPNAASALVDPLHVAAVPVPGSGGSGIDPAALGPLRLPAPERRRLRREAGAVASCLERGGYSVRVADWPGGHPRLVFDELSRRTLKVIPAELCGLTALRRPTQSEATELTALNAAIRRCTDRRGLPPVRIGLSLAFADVPGASRPCVTAARRQQLAPYVASPALLFITTPGESTGALGLSGPNRLRVAVVAALVLAFTVLISTAFAIRLTRPLRRLSEAVGRYPQEPLRVPVTTGDEIGRLTEAFNDLLARQEELEGQRRAMVRDVAHELRGPLSNIRSSLEAAEDGLLATDEELRISLLDEALQLQHLVADLADLAAADAGRLALFPELLLVDDLVEATVNAHRAVAEEAGVALSFEVELQLDLYVDGVRIRQVLSNLLDNAIRHTPSGGKVTVAARGDDAQVEIEVRDTGDGIDADALPHVFDRFWRGDPARGRATGGSGLGLAIVQQLVEAQGGSVAVSSSRGEGTGFTVRLPRATTAGRNGDEDR